MVIPAGAIPASISWLQAQVLFCWNNITTLTICFLLLALLLDYIIYRKRSIRFPPGPTPLPFLGNLLLFDLRKPHATVQHLSKKYGSAFSIQVGWNNYVTLSGFKIIKEALGQKAEDFADRPPVPLLSLAGYTKNCEGFPFNPQNLVNNAVGNIICTLTFGERFEYSDKTFLKLMNLARALMKATTGILPQMMAVGSWFSYMPGPHRKLTIIYNDISAILRDIVNEHKKTRDPTFTRDLIDAFLEEMEKVKGNPESSFNEQNLIKIIYEWVAAGTETTSSTILWGLLKMVLHPEIQKKVHEEIEKVLGKDKVPMMEDQANLPYTNAVIHEIQRCADITPFALPYITRQDTEVDKFVIPKETIIFNHLSSVLKDETMWEKPHQFYPEHFLDANGQFIKREAFLPFSAGRHACPGEPMARMELFIFFTSLLQHFAFCIPENHPRPKEDRVFALTVTPPPFQICAIPR